MDHPINKYVEESGPAKGKTPVEVHDDEHGHYHNPVCDVKQPFSPSADEKHSYKIKEGR